MSRVRAIITKIADAVQSDEEACHQVTVFLPHLKQTLAELMREEEMILPHFLNGV